MDQKEQLAKLQAATPSLKVSCRKLGIGVSSNSFFLLFSELNFVCRIQGLKALSPKKVEGTSKELNDLKDLIEGVFLDQNLEKEQLQLKVQQLMLKNAELRSEGRTRRAKISCLFGLLSRAQLKKFNWKQDKGFPDYEAADRGKTAKRSRN